MTLKKRFLNCFMCFCTAMTMASLASAGAIELLTNGGFETGDLAGWTEFGIGTGGCDTDWNVDVTGAATGCIFVDDPIEGSFAAYNSFDGEAEDFRLTQSFVVPAQVLDASVSWLEAQQMDNFGPTTREWRVDIYDGTDTTVLANLQTLTYAPGVVDSDPSWAPISVDVTALFQAHLGETLIFSATNVIPDIFNGPAGQGFDAASIMVTVPEPAAASLFMTILLVISCVRRRLKT